MSEQAVAITIQNPKRTAPNPWGRFLYNHNPFYVLSVCLVLYGIHVSFQGGAELANGWLLFKILGSYTVVLMAAAILIVRVGSVWEDARTIVLLVIVLIVAISASFDKVCLDSVATGRRIQLFGFVCSIGIVEAMLFGIRAKLPLRYRGPLYLLFALLFYYPTWLGELSITGQDARMSWTIFLFPFIAGAVLLTLVPAAMNGGRGEEPNGTPWCWPIYPWCGLAFIAVALAVRAYGLSVSFELSDGLQSAFHGYFLIPILLAVLWLVTELAISSGKKQAACWLSVLAWALIVLSLPGTNLDVVQRSFLRVVQDNLGSPLQLTCSMLLGYFAYCWLRKLPVGEWGVVGIGLLLSCSRSTTLTLDALHAPQLLPGVALATVLLVRSYFCRDSARYIAGAVLLVTSLSSYPPIGMTPWWKFMGISGLAAWITAGLLFRDPLARFIDKTIHMVLWAAGAVVLLSPFVTVTSPNERIFALLALPILMGLYWCRTPTLRRMLHWLGTSVFLILQIGYGVYEVYVANLTVLNGQRWLILGVLSLVLGVAISLTKAGAIRLSLRLVARWNRWLAMTLLRT